MKCLIIQIFSARDTSCSVDGLLKLTRELGRYPEVDVDPGSDEVSLNYFTEDLSVLWQEIQQRLLAHPEYGPWLAKVAVIGCEGEHGWDDALLLHHYDPNEKCDQL